MATKCEMFINYLKTFIDICKNQLSLPNKEYLRDHRYERTNIAYKYKIFGAGNTALHGHWYFVYIHMCVQFQCEMFNTCSKNFIGICKITNMTTIYGIQKASEM